MIVLARDRLKGVTAAIAVQVLLGWLLISGLATARDYTPEKALSVFRVLPTSPPPIEERPIARRPTILRHVASSRGGRKRAAPSIAAPLVIVTSAPSPVVVALQPSRGVQASSGPDTRAGSGSGSAGDGIGSGGGSPARQIAGEIRNSDYPHGAGDQRRGGSVDVRYLVGTDGHVGDCRIVRSSGSLDLDDATCRLIRARFRFEPARDADGRRTVSWVSDGVDWIIGAAPGQQAPSADAD